MITIVYTAHVPEQLTSEIIRIIRESDILLLECAEADIKRKELEERYNRVSQGMRNPKDFVWVSYFEDFGKKIVWAFYRSGTRVYLERCKRTPTWTKRLDNASNYFNKNNIPQALQEMKECYELMVVEEDERDRNISEFLISLENSNKNKKIVSTLGSSHTPVYRYVKRAGLQCRQVFPNIPYFFDIADEISRRYRYTKKVSDFMLLQSMAIGELADYFKFNSFSDYETMVKTDQIVRQLKECEIREMAKHMSENWWDDLGDFLYFETLGEWLKERGYI